MAADPAPFVALYTDFGNDDPWVGELKASLWSVQPQFKILDMTHAIPAHDVTSGAFELFRGSRHLPPWTINIGVVDPGVGGPRRPIMVITENGYFIGPDNGLFSYIYLHDEVHKVLHLTSSHYFRQPVSATFHARDVFAPIAGWLSKGIDSAKLGDEIEDFVRLPVPVDKMVGESLVKGEVRVVDRFGNLVTNIRQATLDELSQKSGKTKFRALVAGHEMPFVQEGGYSQDHQLFALINSSGLVEIACFSKPASEVLGVGKGKDVGVMVE